MPRSWRVFDCGVGDLAVPADHATSVIRVAAFLPVLVCSLRVFVLTFAPTNIQFDEGSNKVNVDEMFHRSG